MAERIPTVAACPVCSMPVRTHNAKFHTSASDIPRFFCSPGCRDRYLKRQGQKPKGVWGRYLDRMARVNKGQFGSRGPKCH